jgi:hypothetical protein
MRIPGLKASTQEKVNKAISAARKHGGNFVRGVKGSAYSVAVGAVAWDVGKMLTEKSTTIRDNAYALPILYAVGGHLLKRKQYDAGAGLLGVAGFIGRQAYDSEQKKKAAAPSTVATGIAGAANAAPGATAKGVSGGEAGALVGRWTRVIDTRGVSGGEAGGLVGGDPMRAPAARMASTMTPNERANQLMGLTDY